MRSITDKSKNIGFYLKSSWCFDKIYEKIILVAIGLLALLKIVDFFG